MTINTIETDRFFQRKRPGGMETLFSGYDVIVRHIVLLIHFDYFGCM